MTARNLGTIDRDICQPLGRLIQEAFADGIIGDLILSGNLNLGGSILGGYGKAYFVDVVNGSDDNNGEAWANAVKTIAKAIALSNAYIAVAANANKRNVIYIGGGIYTETLVTLPNQCDVIGVGNRTAWKPLISRVMTITTMVNSCRLYNLDFYQETAAPNITIPEGSHGFEMIKCGITHAGSGTYGIQITSSNTVKIVNCEFAGNPPFTHGIYIIGPNFNGCEILGNLIAATAVGIYFHTNVTADYLTLIKDNVIGRMDPNAGDTQLPIGIDQNTDSAGNFLIVHNWISAADAIHLHASLINKASFMCIDNHVVEVATGGIETSGS